MRQLHHELFDSGLTEIEFASRIGVELSRLLYWVELENCRAELREVSSTIRLPVTDRNMPSQDE